MKKIILIATAIFIANNFVSQNTPSINLHVSDSSTCNIFYLADNSISIDSIYKLNIGKDELNIDNEDFVGIVFELDINEVCLYKRSSKPTCRDIVKYEILKDSIIHIVVNEINTMYPDDENIWILTHRYIDLKNNKTVYKYTWNIKGRETTLVTITDNISVIFQ